MGAAYCFLGILCISHICGKYTDAQSFFPVSAGALNRKSTHKSKITIYHLYGKSGLLRSTRVLENNLASTRMCTRVYLLHGCTCIVLELVTLQSTRSRESTLRVL